MYSAIAKILYECVKILVCRNISKPLQFWFWFGQDFSDVASKWERGSTIVPKKMWLNSAENYQLSALLNTFSVSALFRPRANISK